MTARRARGAGSWVPAARPGRRVRRVHRLGGRAGPGALPAPGRGGPRAARRQQRHPGHADRVGEVAGGDGRARRRAGRGPGQLLHRADQGAGEREVLRALRGVRRRRTSACSPATRRSTPTPRSSAAPPRCWPTSRCARAPTADVGLVVMDEFHFYAEPDRGWAWQVPLLELPQAQFLLMSATLGRRHPLRRRPDPPQRPRDRGRRRRRAPGAADLHLGDDAAGRDPRGAGRRPGRRRCTSCTSPRRPRSSTRPRCSRRARRARADPRGARRDRRADRRRSGSAPASARRCRKLLRSGIGVHHAGMLPRYRRLVEQLAQAGLLQVICGTDTLGVGINVPIRTVLFTGLAKFDGNRQRVLRTREFLQIAGRAGRAGFDTAGLRRRAGARARRSRTSGPRRRRRRRTPRMSAEKQAKRKSKAQLRKPPEGTVVWTEQTFDKLVAGRARAAGQPDEGRQRDADQRRRPRGGRLPGAAPAAHRQPRGPARSRLRLARRALRLARSLVHSGRADPARRARRVRPPLRAHRRPAGGLRAQPAAGALRARGARRARPGVADATPSTSSRWSRRCWRRRGRSCSPSSTPPAARRSRR